MADAKISALTSYTPALDADVLPIVDTATTTTKKITWANIKATLLSYFNAIYSTIASPTFTGIVTIPSPFTVGATSVTASGTELNYLVGVTSAIQTQITANLASSTQKATLTTKGDIYAASAASTPVRVGVGSDGQALIADAASTAGVKWSTASPAINYQAFTANGTWTKPASATGNEIVYIEAWGAGGGGGNLSTGGGSGGGGGACVQVSFLASQLSATESITIGVAGAGGGSPAAGTDSSFGSHLTAYGGGAGLVGTAATYKGGGGGGGAFSRGGNGSTTTGGDGGGPKGGDHTATVLSYKEGDFGGGAGYSQGDSNGFNSYFGGGGGGGCNSGTLGTAGGNSYYGGGGGAGGGSSTNGTGGTSFVGGNGGNIGTAGSAPGGGGGAGGTGSTTGQAGARGEIRVWTIF
jgi:hypothetical protein